MLDWDYVMLDWDKAEQHLKMCEQMYAQIGSQGYFALNNIVRPLRDRFNRGERTVDLYEEIMNIAL